jgi:pimeloyl-ACP methyl ester carboxylesterase
MKQFVIATILCLTASLVTAQHTDTLKLSIDGVSIHAVLTQPSGVNNPPLAIFIAGSGPTDLDGNQSTMKNNSLKLLSESLVSNQIATLRFDKRGIAKSMDPNFSESKMTFDRYVQDVESIINQMKAKGFSAIFIVGHSEGSLLGMAALQQNEVKGFVSIAGAGFPAYEILKTQLKPKIPENLWPVITGIIDSLKDDLLVKDVPQPFYSLFRPSVQPYLISWFNYSPTELIAKLKCPTLIVQGDKDIQVSVDDAKQLSKVAVSDKLVIIKNMNHVLKPIAGDIQDNYAAYTNPDLPIDKGLSKAVVDFILSNSK